MRGCGADLGFRVEPPVGIEPTTYSLRGRTTSSAAVRYDASLQVRLISPGIPVRRRPSEFTGLA